MELTIGFLLLASFVGGSILSGGVALYFHMKNKHRPMTVETGKSYLIPKKRKGYFLLINNNVLFNRKDNTRKTQEGSNKDAEDLENLFNDIGFEVVRMNNLKAQEIVNAFQLMTKMIEKQNDDSCFAAAILSHGDAGGVSGTDWGYVQTQYIVNIMSDDNCPSLKGKPKLIFILACQNEVSDSLPNDANCLDVKREITQLSLKPDFFLSVATPLGNLAFRHPEEGSYYVNALVTVFRKHANNKELTALMTEVRHEVLSHADQNYLEKTTLTKSFFFNPLKL